MQSALLFTPRPAVVHQPSAFLRPGTRRAAPPVHLLPLGQSRPPALPDWLLRRQLCHLGLARFPALPDGVRNRLAEELEAILADPSKIAPYIVTLSPSQGRALFEVLYDAGLHLIRDTHDPTLVILWNNGQNERITCRYGDAYLYFGSVKSANHTHGVAPRFARFTPAANHWSHGAQGEHVHLTQWQAQMDYDNLFTVIEGHRDETP